MKIQFLNEISTTGLFGLLAVIAFSLLFAFHRFSVPTRLQTRLILAGLRTFLVLIILFILLDPFWEKTRDSDWVGVLIDTSESVNVRDPQSKASRINLLKDYLLGDSYWKNLEKNKLRQFHTFDSGVRENVHASDISGRTKPSNLISAVREIEGRYGEDPDLLGWILFSDGAATDFDGEVRESLPETSFPWITVGLGQAGEAPNLRLEAPDVRESVFVGERVPLRARWISTFRSPPETILSVRLNGQTVYEKKVKTEAGEAELEIEIPTKGSHALDLELKPLPGEGTKTDNSVRWWLEAAPRKIRVFYAESFYKTDNLFKEALEADKDYEVTFASSLLGFSRQRAVPFIKDPLYGFPKTREALLDYDVIVLSDVKRSLLSTEQIEWVQELVSEQGGALVMIGGIDSFGDGGYVGTKIEDMLPVGISEEYQKDVYLAARGTVEDPFRPKIAEGAAAHPFLKLSEHPGDNLKLWKTVPLLGGYNYVGRLKPGATALLEHPVDESAFGPRVIMAVQNFGRGKVLAFTSDITYNWGQWFQAWRDESDRWVFADFWRHALKGLTENRMAYKTHALQLERTPQLADSSQPLTFKTTLPASAANLASGTLQFELLKNGKRERFEEIDAFMFQEKLSWATSALEEGDYRLRVLYAPPNSAPVAKEMPFTVHMSREESHHLEFQPDVLKKLAEHSGGVYLPFSDIAQLADATNQIGRLRLHFHSTPFWNQPWIYALLLGILSFDWFLRKKTGLE
ncbi:MAG: glutamine amidotransferase [Candidatus Omnitrophota bacterium]|nr:glutamine amidotransferase [Candidatus Omnitrophota bacterium]